MTVFVNQQGKHPLRLKIGRDESVAALKMRIAYKTGLDPQHIRLIHGGRELTDSNQRQLSFNDETVVSLLVRLPGPQDETRYNQPTPLLTCLHVSCIVLTCLRDSEPSRAHEPRQR